LQLPGITQKTKDNICCLNSGSAIKILGFEIRGDTCYINGHQLSNKQDFSLRQFASRDFFG